MSARSWKRIVLVVGAAALAGGCGNPGTRRAYTPRPMPPGVAGTVGEYADLVGANPLPVRGYGVVVGLGKNGSSEVPTGLKQQLVQEMAKLGLGSPQAGTQGLSPSRMLEDKDTAVVVVGGWLPPGAPKGTRFDLMIQALPQTQTLSLVGGTLLSTDLKIALNTPTAVAGKLETWAIAHGDVFINPFVAQKLNPPATQLLSGRILHGGVVARRRPMRLELRRQDWRLANVIQRRLNERFGVTGKVAEAKSPAIVELSVPRGWRDDYEHFLAVVMHSYVAGGAGDEARHVRELAEKILEPGARGNDISLMWEAVGRQVLAVVQPLYSSSNAAAAFFAARAGLRLGDSAALTPMIRMAEQDNSPYQVPAIGELGRARPFVQCVAALRRLLSSRSDVVRVAAYEALVEHGSATSVRRVKVHDEFVLDVVDSDRDYTVYATCAGRPKVVLFGRNLLVRRPVFYCPPDELVTIHAARGDDEKIMVARKVPRTEQITPSLDVTPRVEDLVKTLGSLPRSTPGGDIEGLGLTYAQVVGVLHDLCKNDHVPAKFVLQRPSQIQRIYMLTPAVGRPDMPEDQEQP